jgi:hypothetical protein
MIRNARFRTCELPVNWVFNSNVGGNPRHSGDRNPENHRLIPPRDNEYSPEKSGAGAECAKTDGSVIIPVTNPVYF